MGVREGEFLEHLGDNWQHDLLGRTYITLAMISGAAVLFGNHFWRLQMFSFQTEDHYEDAGKVGGVLNSLIMYFFALTAFMNFYPSPFQLKWRWNSVFCLFVWDHTIQCSVTIPGSVSGVAPGQIQETLCNVGDWTSIHCMKSKCLNCYSISSAEN